MFRRVLQHSCKIIPQHAENTFIKQARKREKPCWRLKRLNIENGKLKEQVKELKKENRGMYNRMLMHNRLRLDKQREIDDLKEAIVALDGIVQTCNVCYAEYLARGGNIGNVGGSGENVDGSGGQQQQQEQQQLATVSVKTE